jgi:undecaprenyl-diphosphatase
VDAGWPPGTSLGLSKSFRPRLLALALVCFLVFGVDTGLAVAYRSLPFDLPLTKAVQSVDFGLYGQTFQFFTWLQGLYQVALAVALIALVFVLHRRAVWLMSGGVVSAVIYQVLNIVIHRPRPDRHLVRVLGQFAGNGYPSGHAAFFSSFGVLLLFCLRRYLRGPFWVIGWIVVILIVVTASVSRIDVGAHWPSDVLSGLALGVGCASLALSVRRLSDPVFET